MKINSIILSIILLAASPAFGKGQIANLQAKAKIKTDVLILGTTHLKMVQQAIDKSALTPVIKILADFQPTAIAIESLRPQSIVTMLNGTQEYQPVLMQFIGKKLLQLAKAEQSSLGVSATQAIKKVEALLTQPTLSPEEQVELIHSAVASYNIHTALLHWKYLKQPRSNSSFSQDLITTLDSLKSSNNEIVTIASELATTLKLNRLYAIDDHLDKDLYSKIAIQLMPSFMKSKDGAAFAQSEYANKANIMQSQAVKTGDWLPLFTWFNSPEYMSQVINKEWKLFVDSDVDAKAGAARIALWEVRNLNMLSNIMRIAATHVGGKIVIVVGSNHKVFLEQYLSNMININIVQFNDLVTTHQD